MCVCPICRHTSKESALEVPLEYVWMEVKRKKHAWRYVDQPIAVCVIIEEDTDWNLMPP